jgi:simple sugar transport system permease protein/ribose transport system permease protein
MLNIKTKFKLLILDNLIWMLLVVLFIINTIWVPKFFTYQNISNIFYNASILGLLILAQGLILMVGQIDLSVETILAFSPGVVMVVANNLFPEVNSFILIIMTLIVGMIVGIFNGILITKLNVNSLLETLSANIVLRGLVLILVPLSLININPGYAYAGGAKIASVIPVAVLIFLGTYFIFGIIVHKTSFGRFLVSTGGNPRASYIAGVNIDRITISVFALVGLISALAGVLTVGKMGAVTSTMGIGLSIMSIAGAILGGVNLSGGRGTIFGVLGGALVLSVFDNFLNLLAVNVYLVSIIKGLLILGAIILDSIKNKLRVHILYREKVSQMEKSKIFIKEEGV